jgi:hypothetical protein
MGENSPNLVTLTTDNKNSQKGELLNWQKIKGNKRPLFKQLACKMHIRRNKSWAVYENKKACLWFLEVVCLFQFLKCSWHTLL